VDVGLSVGVGACALGRLGVHRYSRTWTTPKKTLIATVGIGYADGYPRAASRKAHVTIRGVDYPVVGNVCMDMTM
jgi:alanine racemase